MARQWTASGRRIELPRVAHIRVYFLLLSKTSQGDFPSSEGPFPHTYHNDLRG